MERSSSTSPDSEMMDLDNLLGAASISDEAPDLGLLDSTLEVSHELISTVSTNTLVVTVSTSDLKMCCLCSSDFGLEEMVLVVGALRKLKFAIIFISNKI